jgi:hypothetical protein
VGPWPTIFWLGRSFASPFVLVAMLVSCSAFVNYLVAKSEKAGIEL